MRTDRREREYGCWKVQYSKSGFAERGQHYIVADFVSCVLCRSSLLPRSVLELTDFGVGNEAGAGKTYLR